MTKKILTATGFLMPESTLFELYTDQASQFEEFVGRDNNYAVKTLTKYFCDNKISVSAQANSLYRAYQSDSSYANFIAMVDFMAGVFGQVSCASFLEWQAYNRHLSGMSLMLCRDLALGNLDRFHQYNNLAGLNRFVLNEAITKDQGGKRHKAMLEGVSPANLSWIRVLEPLMDQRSCFVTVFKYFFVNNL